MSQSAEPKIINNPYNPLKILGHKTVLKEIIEGKKIPYPVTIEADLVDNNCNNKCIFCCFNSHQGEKPIFIDKNYLLKNLKLSASRGTKAVELVGGSEPTMHPEFQEIVQKIHDLGLQIGLVTNGLLLTKKFNVSQFFQFIRISLDAGTPQTYKILHGVDCFNKVVSNIKKISVINRPKTIGLGYLCLPQNTNGEEIEKFVQLSVGLKVDYVVFRPAILPQNSDRSYLDLFFPILKRIRKKFGQRVRIYASAKNRWQTTRHCRKNQPGQCHACALTGIIMADGNIPLCNLARRRKNRLIGNIYRSDFSEIWDGPVHRKLFYETNISQCPVPCKANDYRKVIEKYKDKLDSIKIIVSPEADPNFI